MKSTYVFASAVTGATNNFSVLFTTDYCRDSVNRVLQNIINQKFYRLHLVPDGLSGIHVLDFAELQNILKDYLFKGTRLKTKSTERTCSLAGWKVEKLTEECLLAKMEHPDFERGKSDEEEVFDELFAYKDLIDVCSNLSLKPMWFGTNRTEVVLRGLATDKLQVNYEGAYNEITKKSLEFTNERETFIINKL